MLFSILWYVTFNILHFYHEDIFVRILPSIQDDVYFLFLHRNCFVNNVELNLSKVFHQYSLLEWYKCWHRYACFIRKFYLSTHFSYVLIMNNSRSDTFLLIESWALNHSSSCEAYSYIFSHINKVKYMICLV